MTKGLLFVVLPMLLAAGLLGAEGAEEYREIQRAEEYQEAEETQEKYALLIGNGAYPAKLNNPVNDASDMKEVLEALGFTVELLTDADRVQMENAVTRFRNRLAASKESYGFLFYAGHGVQSGGENYLIPVDAEIPSEPYLPARALPLQAVLDELGSAGNALNIVVLDACRDNPFSWRRSSIRGLRVVSKQPADSIIVYATSAGETAADGTGRNGLFTGELLKHLKTPGLQVSEVFRLTGGDVARTSGGKQRPAVYSQYYGTAYLAGKRPAPQAARPVPQQVIRPAPQQVIRPAPQQTRPAATSPATQPKRPGKLPWMEHASYVLSAVYSPNGRRILSASFDNTVKVWDGETGRVLRTLSGWSAAYSPDGRRILSVTGREVKVWDGETGRLLRTLSGHANTVLSAAYSPNGRRILSASTDNTVKVWDGETGNLLRTLSGHAGSVRSAVYSPDGRRILSASTDNTVKVWDGETGRVLRTRTGHAGSVYSAVYSPDGRRILSASADKTLRVWDGETGRVLRILPDPSDTIRSAAYSPDGRRILSAGSAVKVWDGETGRVLRTLSGHAGSVYSAVYSPDGRRILSASADKTLRVWNGETGEQL
jgi:Tol biopolymer transport system component